MEQRRVSPLVSQLYAVSASTYSYIEKTRIVQRDVLEQYLHYSIYLYTSIIKVIIKYEFRSFHSIPPCETNTIIHTELNIMRMILYNIRKDITYQIFSVKMGMKNNKATRIIA